MSVSLESATKYLSERLNGEAFTEAGDTKQKQALQSAVDALSPYTANMEEQNADAAVYLQALWLLGSNAEMQAAGVTSFSVTGLSETFQVKDRPVGIAPEAWRIIKHGIDGKSSDSSGTYGVAWLS